MPRSGVAYKAVDDDCGEEAAENADKSEDKYRSSTTSTEKENHDVTGAGEQRDANGERDDADSNNNNRHQSPHHSNGVLRRTMSFLASLPRKLFSFVREVFYSQQEHRWSRVAADDSDESDWSSSEDGGPSRSNKHLRSATTPRERHRTRATKATPPPIAPKPKRHVHAQGAGSGSSNPPSSADSNTPDITPEISFDDIAIESPQLKPYKRIHGPQGRRRPQRFSNQSDIQQLEINLEAETERS